LNLSDFSAVLFINALPNGLQDAQGALQNSHLSPSI
jgi:hypothetical protein